MITWHSIVISTNYPKIMLPALPPLSKYNLLFRQKYYITSTMPWYDPILITVVLSSVRGGLRQHAPWKITKTQEQNRAARILTSSFSTQRRWVLVTTTWLKRPDCPASNSSSFDKVFKALSDLAPDYLSSMITERSTLGYVLRDSSNKLNVSLPRTKYLKRSFSYRGATLWNSLGRLACNIRQVKSLNIVLDNC